MVLPANMYVLIALKGKDIRRVVTSEDPEWLRSVAEDPEFDPESNKFLIIDEGSSDPEGSGKDVIWYENPLDSTATQAAKEKYRQQIDFGVYESLGDGSACERVRYKTVEEVRRELVERLKVESDGYECPDDFLKLDDAFDRWDTFPNPNRLKHIACYVVTGKRAIEGHYIRIEVVTKEDDHVLLYCGSTIWGFEHACRVANACARHLGA